jgi:hypothetical protein
MSNFTTVSSITLMAVGAASLALAALLWAASLRVGQPKLRWVAAGFGVLCAKSLFILLTIHTWGLDHERVQTVDALADLLAVVLVAVPFLWRR